MRATLLLSLLVTACIVAAADQKCYGLDGTELDSTFAPCKSGGKHSGCCATNRSSGSPDICLDNGLCMATNDVYMGSIFQNGCTDPTGKDPSCPRLCPDVTNNFKSLNHVVAWNIQTCDYGSYCCRAANDRTNCCNNSTAPKFTTSSIGAFTFKTSTPEASSTPTAEAASLSPATTSSTPAPESASAAPDASTTSGDVCKKEREKTAQVGGAVGGIMGAALLGMTCAMLWMHKKEKRQRRLKEHYEEQFSNSWAYRQTVTTSSSRDIGSMIEEKQGVLSEEPDSPKIT